MSKTYRKNIRRTIRHTFSRFAAIFSIVALGVGFLAGLLATTPDMRYSGDRYFDETHLFDVRVVSTLGLTDADADALRTVDGVDGVMPAYSTDMLMQNGAGEVYVTRMHSLPQTAGQEDAADYLNRVELLEGRLPQAANECVVEQGNPFTSAVVALGDTLTVSSENESPEDTLHGTTFNIVGIVKSSYYFSMEREAASVGNGSIGLIAYLPESAFSAEAYTHIYLSLTEARAENALTDRYDDIVDAVETNIEAVGDVRRPARLADIRAEAQVEIDDAQTELDDARKKLDDGRKEYEDGKATADRELADAAKKLSDGERELREGEEKLAEAELQLIGAQSQIDGSKGDLLRMEQEKTAELDAAQETLTAQTQQLEPLRVGVEQADAGVVQAQAAVDGASAAVAQLQPQVDTLLGQQTSLQAQVDALQQAVDAGDETQRPALEQAQGMLAQVQAGLAQAQAGLQQAQSGLQQAQGALAQVQQTARALHAQYDPLAQAVRDGQAQIDAGRTALAQGLQDGWSQVNGADATLQKARVEYNDGIADLAQARKDLADGRAEYETEKAKAEQELADAKKELEDGEDEWADGAEKLAEAKGELADLELPEWYVLDRNTNVSFASFRSNAEKVEAVAKVFPIFFFLVAALVALTTMTRMVEEERLQIGTLKALGYSKGAIMRKYVSYAMLASVLGSAVGLAVGFTLFPTIIWNAYTMMYTLPKLYCQFNVKFAVFSAGAAIGCTLLATLNACSSTLSETAANLMRPRAPKAGKRILLERVGFIWRRMKFTHKVTARNLFRYKKRFFMTVIGISGCTALLMAGFGLQDSIGDIMSRQFGKVFTYDVTITLPEEEAAHSSEMQAALNNPLIRSSLRVHQEKSTNTIGKETFSTYLFVPEDPAVLTEFVSLHTRIGQTPVPFSDTGVVITEKMSERTDRRVGDTIELENSDGVRGTFRVDGVVENYVENYVYLSAETYTEQFGTLPEFTGLQLCMTDTSQEARDALASEMLLLDDVASITFTADLQSSFANMLDKISVIVVVIIVCAGLLAFIVLYNLNNINITERSKEIATIKVLGFFEKEVQGYVYRESAILSVIGTAVGLLLGVILHKFIILTVEVDMVMFGRTVYAMSYVYSAALTLVFSAFVNLVLRRKLRKISMVESMKAPE